MKPFSQILLFAGYFLSSGGLWSAPSAPVATPPSPGYPPTPEGKAPFRMIYSNDTTHIFTSPSPYRPDTEIPFSAELIEGSVKEAAVPGMGAQMIQPGTGWVVWWKSQKFPFARQLAWFSRHYNKNVPEFDFIAYMNNGGDVVVDFLAACRKHNQAAFVSYRLNDLHHLREAIDPSINTLRAIYISQFYVEHPEYKLGKGNGVRDLAHNWAIPQARDEKFAMIDELVRTYDLDGFELDFLRGGLFFTEATPMPERVAAMTDFVGKVRTSLDASARDGRKRWLSVRVPAEKSQWESVGFDPAAWRAAGADIFNLSPSYSTTEQTDVAEVRRLAPDATIYVELTHCAHRWKVDEGKAKLAENYRRSGFEILENAARTAYARGADGVSFFNFPYYRGSFGGGTDASGPRAEPPFHYLSALASPKTLTAPPYYFYGPDERLPEWEKQMEPGGEAFAFTMDAVAPPAREGVLRLQIVTPEEKRAREIDEAAASADRGQWDVQINGKTLREIPNESAWDIYPFEADFPGGFGSFCQYRAWRVPAGLLKDGKNAVSVRLKKAAAPLWLRWAEIFYPEKPRK